MPLTSETVLLGLDTGRLYKTQLRIPIDVADNMHKKVAGLPWQFFNGWAALLSGLIYYLVRHRLPYSQAFSGYSEALKSRSLARLKAYLSTPNIKPFADIQQRGLTLTSTYEARVRSYLAKTITDTKREWSVPFCKPFFALLEKISSQEPIQLYLEPLNPILTNRFEQACDEHDMLIESLIDSGAKDWLRRVYAPRRRMASQKNRFARRDVFYEASNRALLQRVFSEMLENHLNN